MKNNLPKKAMAIILLTAAALLVTVPLGVYGDDTVSMPQANSSGDYKLGAGDLVRVVVWKNAEISGEFRVRPDGRFSMPLIGDIQAEGSTTEGVSNQVEQKLKLFIEKPFVSTIVVEATSNRIYILGEVVKPGTYNLDGSLTVLQALSLAGGFSTYANTDKMILVRGAGDGQKNLPLSYSKILGTLGEENNPVLQRGDTLIVP